MVKLDPKTTALVLIDLQQGILPFAGGPHTAQTVVDHGAQLAKRFRQLNAPVVLVRVGWSDDFGDALKQPVDQAAPAKALPENWMTFAPELDVTEQDIKIVKRQWGAFYGTELDLQLRRRGIKNIVLAGISTNIGVESTLRAAWEHGYAAVVAEDACSGANAEHHNFAMQVIFPRLSHVRSTADVLAALSD
ncbi:hydrolase [Silvimonas amylolytica]|uniref:Hydrolase n=1 Tax=Silvimonas amylolytica TaxID=449663 RepID=A0ABQ2PKI2_9NEIS|nr:hydrolase [Silvimonas amylolytica]GGP25522.1 hydrolase [Silvimonas amylolytica]